MHYLYLVTRDDGEKYVGVSNNPHRRHWEHKNGYGCKSLNGRESTMKILEEGEEDFIYSLEAAAIRAYECSLNIAIGGKNGCGRPGSTNGRAVLTESDVYLIKVLVSQKIPQKEIARRFGVSRQTVGGIATGANWKHVEGPTTYGRICVSEELRCQLKDMKKRGMNAAEISRATGLKYATVYSHVREIE